MANSTTTDRTRSASCSRSEKSLTTSRSHWSSRSESTLPAILDRAVTVVRSRSLYTVVSTMGIATASTREEKTLCTEYRIRPMPASDRETA